ncbi:OLC1v1008696C1 [Oldenlandia corymbosa var. corymbosa]|uniref:pectinesterase n=1 Tax=Oldenlandia corymbosa var. corymbosa TaxID=529605 RepID=A0AAV1DQ16_OLDCO|nr:OLC1v1008696C1 [Oldenlandia corymbosa var. corymbosa]
MFHSFPQNKQNMNSSSHYLSSTLFVSLLLLHSSLSSATSITAIPPPEQRWGTISDQPAGNENENGLIHEACKASRDPPTCESTLSESGHVPPPTTTNSTLLNVIQSATWASSENLNLATAMVSSILNASLAAGDLNLTTAARGCLDGLINSQYRTVSTAEALTLGRIKDARAWMSAALGYESGCSVGLAKVNRDYKTNESVAFLNKLAFLTGNALAMMVNYDNFGEDPRSWGPVRTERNGFWDRVDGSGSGFYFSGGIPWGLEVNVTVCKDGGGCDFQTVQEAVNVAPDNRGVGRKFVIWIKSGVYEEIVRVPLQKKNVVFLGDGMGKTVMTGSLNVGMPGISTYYSATVGVVGDGFMASNITFQNTAGPPTSQAVAFRSQSDLSVIENCEFLGNQDTLYAHSLRQYYKSCRIQGNVDFIFGNAAAFFQDCTILVVPRQAKPEAGETNAVTAQSRTDACQSTGFVFYNCVVNGTEEYMVLYNSKPGIHRNFLGRPWKEYSRTVYINSSLGSLLSSQGWMPWSGEFALATLYYGEFGNGGPGADLAGRVPWSSQIPEEHVNVYTVGNFIQGDDWISKSA